MFSALLTALALACAPAGAQDAQLSAMDTAGNLFSVMTLYTGANNYVQVRKISPTGGILWSQSRNSFVEERAGAAATDQPGGILVAAVQRINHLRTLVLFHYTAGGQYDWERVYSDMIENVPTTAAVDRDGNYLVAGNGLKGTRYVARLWKYGPNGNPLWMREYDNGVGNTYARQLQLDVTNNASLGIESFQSQTATSGQYSLLTATYDPYGNLVSLR